MYWPHQHLQEIVRHVKEYLTLKWIARTHLIIVGISGLKIGIATTIFGEWVMHNFLVVKTMIIALIVSILSSNPFSIYATGVCGDSNLDTPEDCDDAGTSNGNGCNATCDFEFGNGLACDFDSICDPGENIYSCGQDCGSQGSCGNSVCEPEERPATCPQDCGEVDTESCGNLECEDREDHTNCPMDCCTVLVGPFGSVTEWIGGCTDEIPGSTPFCHPCLGGNCPISGSLVTITCGYDYSPDSFETCDNGEIDDDGDDLADCDDPDCTGDPACGGCVDDADCDDGLFCNGAETCNAGSCEAGTDPCAPGDTCNETTDVCESPGCVFDSDCDDGNVCNGDEVCNAGVCEAGTPLSCDDGITCTIDSCDPQTGCSYTPDDGLCDNGLYCDGEETCDVINDCEAGTDPCAPGETCNESNDICEGGSCVFDSDCDDGNVCNGDEVCNAGVCEAGTPLSCDDGITCTIDSCDPQTGCSYTPDDGLCDNGLYCDGEEICDVINDCQDGADPCTGNQTCNETDDLCEDPVSCVFNSDCDDGNVCDGEEICNAGSCEEGTPLSCDDGVSCTIDSCDPQNGCSYAPDDALCDNGLYCDGNETCDLINDCQSGTDPCSGNEVCDENTNSCVVDQDSDGDGIMDNEEQNTPNSGDANMDGTQDYLQPHVASRTTLNIDVDATLEALSGGGCTGIVTFDIEAESNQYTQDPQYAYPLGLQAFSLACSQATVRVYFHGLADIDAYLYRKFIQGNGWISFAITKSSLNNVPYVEFVLEDGGVGDTDGLTNGLITDPGGLALYMGSTGSTSSRWTSISAEDIARAYGRYDPSITLVSGSSTSDSSTGSDTQSGDLVHGSARGYPDYYTILQERLAYQQDYCDTNQSQLNTSSPNAFYDIMNARQKHAILALRHYCVVSGRGSTLGSFAPEGRVSRAEFIKMLMRSIFVGSAHEFIPEKEVYQGPTPFLDVPGRHWSAQYVGLAYELGLLDTMGNEFLGIEMFSPNRSITVEEVIDILLRVDDGEALSADRIREMISDETYPTRGEIAEILTSKLMSKFVDYFYFQGNNYLYYIRLLEELRVRSPDRQHRLLLSQIAKLERKDPELLSEEFDIHAFWMIRFLEEILSYEYEE